MPTVTRLTSNGVFQSLGGFDEVSLNSGSIQFNYSANSYLQISSSTAFNFGPNNFTIEAFVYQTSRPVGANVFSPQNNNCNIFIRPSDGRICFYDGTTVNASTTNLNLNSWNHIALVRSGTNIDMYLNGTNILTGLTNSTNYSAQTFARIGNGSTPNNGLTGYISNLRVLKGVALYTSNFQVLNSPLPAIPNTELLVLANPQNQLKDSSNNNFTITSSNTSFNTIGSFYYPANTSINLANTNNNPAIGSNTNIITSTTSNGVVMISNGFDEVSMSSGSIQFNGSDQRLFNSTTNCTTFGTNDFTVEYWVNYQSLSGGYQQIIGSATTSNGFAFGINAGRLYMTTVSVGYGSSGVVLSTGQWYHVAFVRQSGTVKFYLNGVLDNTVSVATDITELGTSIGGYSNTLYLSNALISNIRVIKGTALYTSNFTPTQTPLLPVANTSLLLNTFAAEPFVDNGPNNITLTSNGTPSANTFTPFTNTQQKVLNTGTMMVGSYDEVVQGSLKFDGSTGYLSVPYTSSFDFGNGNFTIEFWFNPSTTGPGDGVLAIPHNTGNYSPVLIYWASTQIQLYSSSSGTSWDVAGGSAIGVGLSTNTWYHVAISRSGPSIWTFLNGQLQQTINFAGTFTGTYDRVWIGDTTGNSNFNGLLSNIHVVKGTALYTVNFTPPRRSLLPVSNTVLLLNTTTLNPFVDNSGNNKIITVNGGVTSNSLCYF